MDLMALIPSFGNVLWTFLAFVAALSIIVAVHEYGHYIVGRWCGIKADVFSLGMGPKLFGVTDKHGTYWQIAALPFGGYVKFKGDGDASSATRDGEALAQLSEVERRATMPGAPLWARAATVAAGPAFNFALSILIFTGVVLFSGVATNEARIGAVKPLPLSQNLRAGDLVLAVEGEKVEDLAGFVALSERVQPAESLSYLIERHGQTMTVEGPYLFPPLADAVQPDSAAQAAGLKSGDIVRAINGQPIYAFSQLREVVGQSEGAPVQLSILRGNEALEVELSPRKMDLPKAGGGFETRYLIGLTGGLAFEPERRATGLFEALSLGAQQMWMVITTSLSGLWHMVTGAISSCNLRGPLGIAESSGAAASMGGTSFIWFIAMLSTAVGMMNLFPVPVLDGGHLVFHAWEAVTGKPPSDKALRGLMTVGVVLLMGLMAFALTNDIFCP